MTAYEQLQHDAAVRFLQTGLIVDDRISTDPSLEPELVDKPAPLLVPQGPLAASRGEKPKDRTKETNYGRTEEAGEDVDSKPKDALEQIASVVDVKRLADKFVDLVGLTCGVLKPEGDDHDKVIDRIVRAARGVDIVVLDWMLEPDVLTAEKAILEIVADGSYGPRVLAVYTTQRNLGEISDVLKQKIDNASDVPDDELALDAGGTRIVVFHKGGPSLSEENRKYLCSEEDLPGRLVAVFVEQVRGLVPAVALNAVAATRENTHRLLARLHSGLDLGYLGHLVRYSDRLEAGQHLLDAISGEFRAVIEDDAETGRVAVDGFDAWLVSHEDQLQVGIPGLKALASAREAEDDGKVWKKWCGEYNAGDGVAPEKITTLLVASGAKATAVDSDARFAQLMAMRRPYSRASPALHLGAIVREEVQSANYWLCVQPVCDAVRLPENRPTNFLMLPLQHVDGKLKTAFVVDDVDHGDPVRLWLWNASSDIELMRLRPNHRGTVRFESSEGGTGPRTVRTEEGVVLVWAGQLKPAHAIRVAHEYGSRLSRVGLDESEWLRALGRRGARPEQMPRTPMVERVRNEV